MAVGLAAAGLLAVTPAQAADEWTQVSSWGTSCDASAGGHSRTVYSSVRGAAADSEFTICWNDALTDVRVFADAYDSTADGYHAEARIRYQVWTGSAWSGWHYRAPAAAYGAGTYATGWYKANQKTRYVQAAACLYDGATLIDCDDKGWQ